MKQPLLSLKKKTVFIYKSIKNTENRLTTDPTDPVTTLATMTVSSTVCIGVGRH